MKEAPLLQNRGDILLVEGQGECDKLFMMSCYDVLIKYICKH